MQEPTKWVSSMVVAVKNGKVRICIDPRDLNKAILRGHHLMKTVEEVASNIPKATVFSVLDAKQGFLRIKLDNDSSYLTIFNTPQGRYRWLRLPFGLKCAPEIFQCIMDNMLEDIDGAEAIMDDILIAGKDKASHDAILKKVLQKAADYNLKLNFQKCKIGQTSVRYCGHLTTQNVILPDPDKVQALSNMPSQDKAGVKRFLGLVTCLG